MVFALYLILYLAFQKMPRFNSFLKYKKINVITLKELFTFKPSLVFQQVLKEVWTRVVMEK